MNTETKQIELYEGSDQSNSKLKSRLKNVLIGGFAFFLIKGIIWLLVFFGIGSLFN